MSATSGGQVLGASTAIGLLAATSGLPLALVLGLVAKLSIGLVVVSFVSSKLIKNLKIVRA